MTNYNQIGAKRNDKVERNREKIEEPVVETKPSRGVVDIDLLNVRPSKSTDGAPVKVIKKSDELEVDWQDSDDEWLHVYLSSGVDGYVMKKFIVI